MNVVQVRFTWRSDPAGRFLASNFIAIGYNRKGPSGSAVLAL